MKNKFTRLIVYNIIFLLVIDLLLRMVMMPIIKT